jgi:hypothetical protein
MKKRLFVGDQEIKEDYGENQAIIFTEIDW